MKSILAALKRNTKRNALLGVLVGAVMVPVGLYAYGPERPTYTIENAANHVTFNSITNNPNIGDERNFVGARENNGDNGMQNTWNANEINVQPGKEYIVRMYVHNNAKASLGLKAENVLAQFNMDTDTSKSHEVQGTLSASNASPKSVYDHVTLKSDKEFNLAYVPGSLRYENNKNSNWKFAEDNKVFSSGVKLGYDAMNGEVPGCFEYAGYLTFLVKPQFAGDFSVSKQVKLAGTTGWKETIDAKSGDTVEYLLKYQNTGDTQQDNVTFVDKLPKGLSYIDGSATYKVGANGAETKATKNVTTTGVNLGSFAPQAGAWLKFSAKVSNKDELECGVNNLRNIVSVKPEAGNYQPKEDDATVKVTKDCAENPVEKKVKVCDTTTKQIVEVTDEQSKDSKYTANVSECAEMPSELPETGLNSGLAVLGLGSLVAAGAYYINSRRVLN